MSHLNNLSPSINFTVEKEQEKKLPFLDVLVTRQEDGTLDTSVYRKKTHTDRYPPFTSHHPSHTKKSAVTSLVRRARDVTSKRSQLKKELHHITSAFRGNGYPAGYLKKYTKLGKSEGKGKKVSSEDQNEDEEKDENKPLATATIPYIKGLSEAVRRIRTAFKTTNTLGRTV